MSTRSFIGTITPNGDYQGRYIQSDGYPTGMGKNLATLIARDGLDTVLRVLTQENYGWSSVTPETPDIHGVRANHKADFGTAAHQASLFRGKFAPYTDGRFANLAGYGIAYTTKRTRNAPKGQSSANDWEKGTLDVAQGTGTADTWCEWGYLFDTDAEALHVAQVTGGGDGLALVATIGLADLLAQDWDRIECGEHYERCCHYAWFHVEVPEASRRLGMAQWLGEVPLRPMDAVGALVNGERLELTGSGSRRGNVWTVFVAGRDEMVPVFQMGSGDEAKPLPGVELIYPPVAQDALLGV